MSGSIEESVLSPIANQSTACSWLGPIDSAVLAACLQVTFFVRHHSSRTVRERMQSSFGRAYPQHIAALAKFILRGFVSKFADSF